MRYKNKIEIPTKLFYSFKTEESLKCNIEMVIDSEKIYNKKEIQEQKNLNTFVKNLQFTFSINPDGEISIFDKNKIEIKNEKIIKKIKRTTQFKKASQKLSISLKEKFKEKDEFFMSIYSQTPSLRTKNEFEKISTSFEIPDLYKKNEFEPKKPTIKDAELELKEIAKSKFPFNLFKNFLKQRKEFIQKNLQSVYEDNLKIWNQKKEKFDENEEYLYKNSLELNKKSKKNKQYIEDALKNTNIEIWIEYILENLKLPYNLKMSYEYSNNTVYGDILTPCEEELPQNRVNILKSGKASVKSKLKKDYKYLYLYSTLGTAIYIAGVIFNVSPHIENIILSGLDRKTNEFHYSIDFDRLTFMKLKIDKLTPIEAIYLFKNNANILSTYTMKPIKPLE
ncbi:hypothetical protein C7380_1084 [Oceanotoga teriensis]|uniref:Uncharacterized protein n=1 Tax=Oceanotoga teriensis TaxID=515440 RepID=A0AA45C6P4_9BACT|nr:hypothetical protein [Oceanotoga teriensis]PWJ93175.1 hypothetical protein C7380_1084 [Oceanotoga teriensis]